MILLYVSSLIWSQSKDQIHNKIIFPENIHKDSADAWEICYKPLNLLICLNRFSVSSLCY